MSDKSVEFRFTYESFIAHGRGYASENHPCVRLYLTDHAAGDAKRFFSTREVTSGKPLVAKFPLEDVDENRLVAAENLLPATMPRLGTDTLPYDAALVVRTYADTFSDQGQGCRTDTGTATVLLRSVELNTWYPVIQNTPDDAPLVKGRVMLKKIEWRNVSIRFAEEPPARVPTTDAISRNMDFYFGERAEMPHPRRDFLSHVHCPVYRTPFSDLPASCCSFRLNCHEPDQRVYEQTLRVVLRREELLADDVLETIERQLDVSTTRFVADTTTACALLGRFLTIHATSMVYLDDFANTQGDTLHEDRRTHGAFVRARRGRVMITEDFREDEAELKGGDCEDVAILINQMWNHFQRMRVDPSLSDDVSALLAGLQRLAAYYDVMLMLADVTNKKLDIEAITVDDAMAHTVACLMPRQYFCARMVPSSCADAALLLEMTNARMTDERAWESELPFLTLEGTAPQNPLPREVAVYYSDRMDQTYIAQRYQTRKAFVKALFRDGSVSTKGLQIESFCDYIKPNKKTLSPFYVCGVSFYSPVYKKWRICDWTLVHNGTDTYGVTYRELVSKDSNVKFMASLRFTEAECVSLNETMLLLEPVPLWNLPVGSACDVPLVQSLERMARRYPAPVHTPERGATGMNMPQAKVTFTRREEDLTSDWVYNFERFLERQVAKKVVSGLRVTATPLHVPADANDTLPRLCIVDFEVFLAHVTQTKSVEQRLRF